MLESLELNFVDITGDIVAAFVGNNSVHVADLPNLIETVHAALASLGQSKQEATQPALTPAVSIKRSITDDHLICLEDGKKFKSLKRHLQTAYGMTPDDYRTKWGLPRTYPMVAPGYAAKRSELAKASGLGSNLRKQPEAAPEPVKPAPANDAATAPVAIKNKVAAKRAKAADQVAGEAPAKRRGRPAKTA